MTPKEKADELVKRMYKVRSDSVSDITLYFSKQCALICCDEVLSYMGADRGHEFWMEVKKEIENYEHIYNIR
jgi:hypothetical protein